MDYCRGSWDGSALRVDLLIDELADYVPARADVEAGDLALACGDLAEARSRLHGGTSGQCAGL